VESRLHPPPGKAQFESFPRLIHAFPYHCTCHCTTRRSRRRGHGRATTRRRARDTGEPRQDDGPGRDTDQRKEAHRKRKAGQRPGTTKSGVRLYLERVSFHLFHMDSRRREARDAMGVGSREGKAWGKIHGDKEEGWKLEDVRRKIG
jgi:hypothetical protein